MYNIEDFPGGYPIEPEDINTEEHFWNAFDNAEAEVSARRIVKYCQDRGKGWSPIWVAELYSPDPDSVFRFNGLTDYLIVDAGAGDRIYFTHEFIARCFLASPRG